MNGDVEPREITSNTKEKSKHAVWMGTRFGDKLEGSANIPLDELLFRDFNEMSRWSKISVPAGTAGYFAICMGEIELKELSRAADQGTLAKDGLAIWIKIEEEERNSLRKSLPCSMTMSGYVDTVGGIATMLTYLCMAGFPMETCIRMKQAEQQLSVMRIKADERTQKMLQQQGTKHIRSIERDTGDLSEIGSTTYIPGDTSDAMTHIELRAIPAFANKETTILPGTKAKEQIYAMTMRAD